MPSHTKRPNPGFDRLLKFSKASKFSKTGGITKARPTLRKRLRPTRATKSGKLHLSRGDLMAMAIRDLQLDEARRRAALWKAKTERYFWDRSSGTFTGAYLRPSGGKVLVRGNTIAGIRHEATVWARRPMRWFRVGYEAPPGLG